LTRFSRSHFLLLFLFFLLASFFPSPALTQENPYIVAYHHYLEEPGNLEIEYFSTFRPQRDGNGFHAFWTEFEYGAAAWWTTEFYLDAQHTFNDSTLFWVLTNGVVRRGMPAWSKPPEPQRWQLVAYIKSLGRSPAKPDAPPHANP